MNDLKKLYAFEIHLSSATFVLLLALYFGFVLNIPVTEKFISLAEGTGTGQFAYFSPLLLSAFFVILFSPFNLPYLRKPLAILLVLTSAIASYATYRYGVMFDYGMVENIFETNSGEAFSYVNSNSTLYFVAFGAMPAVLIYKVRFKAGYALSIRMMQHAFIFFSALAVVAIIYNSHYKEYASIGRNNAYLRKMIVPAHLYNAVRYINRNYLTSPMEYSLLGLDAQPAFPNKTKPSLTVLVLGETARSMNFSYNGYERNTNPHTAEYNLISLPGVDSCGTATAHSVPCMFSLLNRKSYSKEQANAQDNILDIIQRAGVQVTWIENDGGDKEVARNVRKIKVDAKAYPDICHHGLCADEVVLEEFVRAVDLNSAQDQLVIVHISGSHGPTYWQRYPQEHEIFSPSCNRSDIENCSDQEIVNVYDNTIAYTDFVLSKLIDLLKQQRDDHDVALMYISDHGESLGEDGIYLHGTPYFMAPEQQTKVPWLLWLDDGFAKSHHLNTDCLRSEAKLKSYSHDNFSHTLIDFAGVATTVRHEEESFLAACQS